MTTAILLLICGGFLWMLACLALARLRGRQIEREIETLMANNANLRFDSPPKLSNAQLGKIRAQVRANYKYN